MPSVAGRMGHFKDLKAWQHARSLAVLSKAAIAQLPESEREGLADQWKGASYSVVLNIAEGASRRGTKEFRRFLDIARGSLHEIDWRLFNFTQDSRAGSCCVRQCSVPSPHTRSTA